MFCSRRNVNMAFQMSTSFLCHVMVNRWDFVTHCQKFNKTFKANNFHLKGCLKEKNLLFSGTV